MESDPRIKAFKLDFPVRKPSTGLKPMRTYHGLVRVEVTEPVAVSQLRIQFEGWERIDFGGRVGATRKPIFRSSEDLLLGSGAAATTTTITGDATFAFACTMPNVNFPSAMQSEICEIAYTVSASLAGPAQPPEGRGGPARAVPLAADSEQVQLMPRVIPSGVGWLKPMVMRDGVMLSEPVRRVFRRHTVQTAMNICVQVRNHCCTLGEAISVDVDATMLQKDRVLTFVRAAVVEQVALKTQVRDAEALALITAFLDSSKDRAQAATVVLAERTLNRKVSEVGRDALAGGRSSSSSSGGGGGGGGKGAAAHDQALPGLDGVQCLCIRVPRRDVCTAEGRFLKFSHVLRLTFGLTSRASGGRVDTKYATKDVPLRLVTSKFGDVGRMSQAEINKRLSALTTGSDGSAVSEAYGYLLSENSRATRPAPLDDFDGADDVPAPKIAATPPPTRPLSSDAYVGTPSPAPLSPGAPVLRPQSSRSYFYDRRALGAPATPTPLTALLTPHLLPGSTRFETRPLPPIPAGAAPSLDKGDLDKGSPDRDDPDGDDPGREDPDEDESALYMVSRQSGSGCSDDDDGGGQAPNRDTLVDVQPVPEYSASRESLGSIGTSGSVLSQRTPSGVSLACSVEEIRPVSPPRTQHPPLSPRLLSLPLSPSQQQMLRQQQQQQSQAASPRPSARLAANNNNTNNKRGSAQSESETIVSLPCSGRPGSVQDAEPAPRKADRPELPELPVMESFGDMAMRLLGSPCASGSRDDLSASSFWDGVGF
ncbi:hypothetical protein H4R18_004418 [Coemansia javaensis]|uniref:Arrestin-like N-terminal domain-containing protein n=1 Tax=Coemansia javaensis TaxID=2761396 RepID=A0A9W8H4Z6_9FUNG|nr:hypothetical protein H4R18_004418 [Coemansia javaensis]